MTEKTELVYRGVQFAVEFYIAANGKTQAREWLDMQDLKTQQKFAALFERLADHGRISNETKFKHLTGSDGIFEFKDGQGRVLCFFYSGRRVILTHGFAKKAQKTPPGEIARAQTLKHEFERR